MTYPRSPFGAIPSLTLAAELAGSFGSAVELTISGGAVIGDPSYKNLLIDTEAGAASDDLDSIGGYNDGNMVMIRPANDTRTVVVKNGANLILQGVDFTMDADDDAMLLLNIGSNKWIELSRADNG